MKSYILSLGLVLAPLCAMSQTDGIYRGSEGTVVALRGDSIAYRIADANKEISYTYAVGCVTPAPEGRLSLSALESLSSGRNGALLRGRCEQCHSLCISVPSSSAKDLDGTSLFFYSPDGVLMYSTQLPPTGHVELDRDKLPKGDYILIATGQGYSTVQSLALDPSKQYRLVPYYNSIYPMGARDFSVEQMTLPKLYTRLDGTLVLSADKGDVVLQRTEQTPERKRALWTYILQD